MNRLTTLLLLTVLAPVALRAAAGADTTLLRHVDPFIGTTNYGTCNPGAVVPNGLMSATPFNVTGSPLNRIDKDSQWWSTPYDVTNSYLTGFSHVNLSGVGCPELATVLTMATTGPLEVDYRRYGTPYTGEKASPGYYATRLSRYGILAEVTATERTSRERFTFPGGDGNILVNLGVGLTNETGASVRRLNDTTIVGTRLAGTFCYNPQAVFAMHFAVRVNRLPSAQGFWKMQPPMTGVEAQWTPDAGTYKIYTRYGRDMAGDDLGYWFTFKDLKEGEQVELSVAVSFVSQQNALANLDAEQPAGTTFSSVLADARGKWARMLSCIKVEGGTGEQLKIFYTALYHTLIHPNLIQDANGDYPMMESAANGNTGGANRYTVFSLWDTYRNLHQLLTLAYPSLQADMLRSMTSMAGEWGWLPKWELYGRETFTMEGDPAIPVIVDSWMKGLRDFDIDAAYEAMKRSATTPGAANPMRPDIDPYLERGYIPLGTHGKDPSGDNSVSHALEYYVADNALARLARERGDTLFARRLEERARGYRHYYSAESGTLRPLNPDGTFLAPFNPRQGENFEPVAGFHEGSAWNYTFFVPHDPLGLAELMGGKEKMVEKLQMVFDTGLYDPANEPDIAYPYLFCRFPGHEWRTDRQVSSLLAEHFTTAPDGIPGNDDTGTMSAWAVFSMMGLYPDCPGEPFYSLTVPVFDRVTITPLGGDGAPIVIERAKKRGSREVEITLGGKPAGRRISHGDLMNHRHLKFTTPK